MGILKDLRKKVADGEATDEEKVELEEIEEDVKGEEDEKAVDDATEKLLAAIELKNKEMLDKVVAEKEAEKKTKSGFEAEYEKMSDEKKSESFIKAVLREDTAKLKVMSVGADADGGYLVPTVLNKQVVEEMQDVPTIRAYSKIIPNCPATLNITSLVGRPKAKFRAEKAVKDTSTATYDQISLTPYSLACIVPMTNELIEDAEAGGFIVSEVTRLMAEGINDRENRAFAVGDGTTQPTGINAYAGTVGRTVTTPANVATADSLIDTELALGAAYRSGAKMLMNTLTLRAVRHLKDGNDRYMFNNDITKEFVGTILGYPVVENNYLPKGVIWFINLKKGYWIGDRGGLRIDKSEEATLDGVGNLFEQNMTAIRVEKRVDAELADTNAAVYLSGMN